MARARRGDHVLLQHDRAEVVHAEVEAQLARRLAGGQPRRLEVLHVVEVQAGRRQQPQVLHRRRLRAALEVVVLRLVGPGDERAEAAGAVLHVADHAQVLDPLRRGLAGAHHHRRGGFQAQVVSGLHDLQPALAGLLERRQGRARPRGEHLRARPGDRVEPGGLDPLHGLLDPGPRDLRHVGDLRGADGVDRQLRVLALDGAEERLVVLHAELGVVAALEHHLGGAEVDRLAAAAQDLVERVLPALLVLGGAVEGAELAGRHADVGVVDVAVDDVGDDVVADHAPAGGVRRFGQRVEGRFGVEQLGFLGADPAAVGGAGEDIVNLGHERSVSGEPGAVQRPCSE